MESIKFNSTDSIKGLHNQATQFKEINSQLSELLILSQTKSNSNSNVKENRNSDLSSPNKNSSVEQDFINVNRKSADILDKLQLELKRVQRVNTLIEESMPKVEEALKIKESVRTIVPKIVNLSEEICAFRDIIPILNKFNQSNKMSDTSLPIKKDEDGGNVDFSIAQLREECED